MIIVQTQGKDKTKINGILVIPIILNIMKYLKYFEVVGILTTSKHFKLIGFNYNLDFVALELIN